MKWFSAKLRLVCMVEGQGAKLAMDTLRIFQADDFDDAFERALQLGRESEHEYRNVDGALVRWQLKQVLSLDVIRADDLNGAEVYSDFVDLPAEDQVAFDAVLHPERSKPDEHL